MSRPHDTASALKYIKEKAWKLVQRQEEGAGE